MGVNINEGTQTNIATDPVGTVNYQKIKLDIGAAGVSSLFTGTIPAVSNLATGTLASVANVVKGTITKIEGGTIGVVAAGTVTSLTAGTIQTYGLRHADAFSTVVSTGTNTMGTIKATVAGSSIYVTDLIISAGSATNVEIASGGTSTPIMGTLFLSAQGGAVMNFVIPMMTASGSALVYKQSTAVSPLSITCNGYVN
jgi:hypothetical protein